MKTQLYIGSDHAGFALKSEFLKGHHGLENIEWVDLGPSSDDRVDYPDYASRVAEAVLKNPDSIGILICGSGQGMCMRANKYPGIRAAMCWSEESAALSRQHNDANILCLGARLVSTQDCLKILKVFMQTEFEGGRHLDRVKKISREV